MPLLQRAMSMKAIFVKMWHRMSQHHWNTERLTIHIRDHGEARLQRVYTALTARLTSYLQHFQTVACFEYLALLFCLLPVCNQTLHPI